jgi:hypothetical protein
METSIPSCLTGASDPVYLTLEYSVDHGSRQLRCVWEVKIGGEGVYV